MIQTRTFSRLAVLSIVVALSGAAEARQVISINFSTSQYTNALNPWDSAGVVSAENWNNVGEPDVNCTPSPNNQFIAAIYSGSYTGDVVWQPPLVNSIGQAVPLKLRFSGMDPNDVESVTGTSPDAVMMTGESSVRSRSSWASWGNFVRVYAQVEISTTDGRSLAEVMRGAYQVYVYYGVGAPSHPSGQEIGGRGQFLFSESGYTDRTPAQFYDVPSSTFAAKGYITNMGNMLVPGYLPSPSYQTYGDPSAGGRGFVEGSSTTRGNYVTLGNVTASNLVITAVPEEDGAYRTNAGNCVAVLGIQIVGPTIRQLESSVAGDGTISFGTVNGDSTVFGAVMLTNVSDSDASAIHLTGSHFTGDFASHFSLALGNDTATMFTNDAQTFDIVFSRDGLAAGTYETDLVIGSDSLGQEALTYHVMVDVAELTAHLTSYPNSGTAIDFGAVDGSATEWGAVVLVNDGDAGSEAHLTGANFTGDAAGCFSLAHGDSFATLEGTGGMEFFDVFFDATGLGAGLYEADLTITSDLGDAFAYHLSANYAGSEPPAPVTEPAGLVVVGLALSVLGRRRRA